MENSKLVLLCLALLVQLEQLQGRHQADCDETDHNHTKHHQETESVKKQPTVTKLAKEKIEITDIKHDNHHVSKGLTPKVSVSPKTIKNSENKEERILKGKASVAKELPTVDQDFNTKDHHKESPIPKKTFSEEVDDEEDIPVMKQNKEESVSKNVRCENEESKALPTVISNESEERIVTKILQLIDERKPTKVTRRLVESSPKEVTDIITDEGKLMKELKAKRIKVLKEENRVDTLNNRRCEKSENLHHANNYPLQIDPSNEHLPNTSESIEYVDHKYQEELFLANPIRISPEKDVRKNWPTGQENCNEFLPYENLYDSTNLGGQYISKTNAEFTNLPTDDTYNRRYINPYDFKQSAMKQCINQTPSAESNIEDVDRIRRTWLDTQLRINVLNNAKQQQISKCLQNTKNVVTSQVKPNVQSGYLNNGNKGRLVPANPCAYTYFGYPCYQYKY